MPESFMLLSALLFCIGLVGVVSRRNLFVIYMSVELMLSSVNLLLATFSKVHGSADGAVMALLIVAVIAAEAAVFLSMIVALYRQRRSVDPEHFNELAQGEHP